jgi:hypothetical protein
LNLLRFHTKRIRKFDDITQIRLILLGFITILLEIIFPILGQYYGHLKITINDILIQSATIIAFFSFLKQIGMKIVKFIMDNFSFSNVFKIMILTDTLWVLGTSLFFVDPIYMLWSDLLIGTIQLPFFISFSNMLNNYITYFYNEKFTFFQEYKNELLAESGIVGLLLSMTLTFISIKLAISIFIVGMIGVIFFQIKSIHKFKKEDFKYMYKYKKSKRIKN